MTAPGTEVEVLLVGTIAVQSSSHVYTLVQLPTGEVASIPTGAADVVIRKLSLDRKSTADLIEEHQLASLLPLFKRDQWDAACACGVKTVAGSPDVATRWHAEHLAAELEAARRA